MMLGVVSPLPVFPLFYNHYTMVTEKHENKSILDDKML